MSTFRDDLAGQRPLIGMWVASASETMAEICAGSGLDWLLIDSEHVPNDITSILAQLRAVAPHPIHPVVRPPDSDTVFIKRLLDIGVTTLLIPMVDTPEEAEAVVAAVRYPPRGVRGIGSALGRASRWNRTADYLEHADDGITTLVQIESRTGLDNIEAIAAVDGIDGMFVGPADLAGSMGLIGQQSHPEVVGAVEDAITRITAAGRAAGVNAFDPATARRYLGLGCRFVLVGADVTLVARGSSDLAAAYRDAD